MDQNPTPTIVDSLGEEIIRIITPVTICMSTVVILVNILSPSSSISSIATAAYSETVSDTTQEKFLGAVLNSLVFIAVITAVTFFLLLLFYLRCTSFLKYYMGFSSFLVLSFMGGEIAVLLIEKVSFPIDCVTFVFILFNFSVIGVLAVFLSKFAIFVTQSYLVFIGVLVAYWFTMLPEWTTWVLLVALALYDLAAVLLPVGPLRLLVELAISRDEDIPALVYEARPVGYVGSDVSGQRRLWRGSSVSNDENSNGSSEIRRNERDMGRVEEGPDQLTVPLIERMRLDGEDFAIEGIGLGSSGAIKLGLGDFIFYSVLVGRAAMYDVMTVYACYLAIVAGLGITLMLLAVYQKALPALPVSIMLENCLWKMCDVKIKVKRKVCHYILQPQINIVCACLLEHRTSQLCFLVLRFQSLVEEQNLVQV